MLVPGIIHTLLTLVSRLRVLLVLHYNKCCLAHKESSTLSSMFIHPESSLQRQVLEQRQYFQIQTQKLKTIRRGKEVYVQTNNSICCQIPHSALPHLTSSVLKLWDPALVITPGISQRTPGAFEVARTEVPG